MTKLTKEEQIQAIYDLKVGYTLCHDDVAMLKAMARQLLYVLEQEPVATFYKSECGNVFNTLDSWLPVEGVNKLYAAPQLPQPAVPECYQRLLHHAYGMTMGHDWNKGTMAGHHREKLCKAVEDCRAAMLQGADGTLTNEGTMPATKIKPVADLYSIAVPGGRSTTYSTDAAEASDCRVMGWTVQEYVKLERYQAAMLGAEPVSQSYTLREGVAAIRNSGIAIDADKIQAERDALNEPTCWCLTCRPVTMTDMRFVVCPKCGNKRCPHANDHRNACTGSNEPGQEGSAYPAAPQQEAE